MAHGGKRPGAGKPKGSKASHTLEAATAKSELIKAYIENIRPINNALIKKAIEGDIQAIKELHDRVYGKSAQPIVGDKDNPIQIQHITGMKIQKE